VNRTFEFYAENWLKCVGNSRYLGVYNNVDWRCYKTSPETSSVKNTRTLFYRKTFVPCPYLYANDTISGCDSVVYYYQNGDRDVFYESVNLMETMYSQLRPECDSFVVVHIVVGRSYILDTLVQAMDSLWWREKWYKKDCDTIERLESSSGCDSLVRWHFRIELTPSVITPDDSMLPRISVCPSDTVIQLPYGKSSMKSSELNLSIGKVSSEWSMKLDTAYYILPEMLELDSVYEMAWVCCFTDSIQDTCLRRIKLKLPPCGTSDTDEFLAVDAEGNRYKTVRIGYNCWMAENLKSTCYSDSICFASGQRIAVALPYFIDEYPDTTANAEMYGRLYDWYSVVGVDAFDKATICLTSQGFVRGICPMGWRLPTEEDFQVISDYNFSDLASVKGWLAGNGTDSLGFNVKPAGYYDAEKRKFYNLLGNAYFWTTTSFSYSEAVSCALKYSCKNAQVNVSNKSNGYSVRCLKE
ncbi:MAG: fibrobacter succinogenes major paralogous domain-containing protein, partial [Bacteroidales bacterium]|nr:fibrobacter succinogenes major paralogous domain-containing protein [Bacteroidales bacterium]